MQCAQPLLCLMLLAAIPAAPAAADLSFRFNFFINHSLLLFLLATTPTESQPPSLLSRDILFLGLDGTVGEWGNNNVWTYEGNTADGRCVLCLYLFPGRDLLFMLYFYISFASVVLVAPMLTVQIVVCMFMFDAPRYAPFFLRYVLPHRPYYHNEGLAMLGFVKRDFYIYYDTNCDGKTGAF